ncbi:hypothetical protein [Lysobacter sp. Root494]|uniref:hypothetical protein n=1 Tax=Lysobacter sp. Root494 TaxID=1736549 RepID=UPI0006F88FDD|nr:hypothetical protein [Lysobacter sp. Root494]KQY51192.1 hypothetical protein ASD14_10335 [Lysobacter sp. Root494]
MKNNLTNPPSALFRQLRAHMAAPAFLLSLGAVPNNRSLERLEQLVADQPLRMKRALEVEAKIAAWRRTKSR